ncbi:unnamed protein product [Microthlaspi erraticum]|uniref:RING-type domain-containing protein n=1 Tax=Microthlaspi erraticum TaxID=1685480 RepID=A0A6D2K3V1_9BRAS|nr:unnamed protein product [Microthlaspi erraticum]
MDSKESDDGESLKKTKEMISNLQERIEKVTSELKASGPSASASADLLNLSKEIQQLLMVTRTNNTQDPSLRIHDELDKVFDAEKVGHSCNLCQGDLASDPERPGASLRSLQEACVLSCGHVYHFKCLRGTTLDLDNHSSNPSCIFCVSSSD